MPLRLIKDFKGRQISSSRSAQDFGEHGRELITVEVALKLLELLSDPLKLRRAVNARGGNLQKLEELLHHSIFKVCIGRLLHNSPSHRGLLQMYASLNASWQAVQIPYSTLTHSALLKRSNFGPRMLNSLAMIVFFDRSLAGRQMSLP